MALKDEIEKQSTQIKTDSYQMSIGELLNLYRDDELDVHPEFQRVYRWTSTQKTRLIESILLGIPIPPIFVAQRADGVWDVVDGVQRLSTIFEFVGVLKGEDGQFIPPLVLEKTRFLPSLEGCKWEDGTKFAKENQLYIKRSKIDVKIVLKESDDKSKYELFMRLNTGGSPLTAQEVRNCLMLMAYPKAYDWIKSLSVDAGFQNTIALSDNDKEEQYAMELVTRFLTFRTMPQEKLAEIVDIGDFLDNSLENLHGIAKDDTRRTNEEQAFRETFRVLDEAMQDEAFRRYHKDRGRFGGPFSTASFEVIAMGVGYNFTEQGTFPFEVNEISEKVKSVWSNPIFNKYSGAGVRASNRIPKIIPVGRELFSK